MFFDFHLYFLALFQVAASCYTNSKGFQPIVLGLDFNTHFFFLQALISVIDITVIYLQ